MTPNTKPAPESGGLCRLCGKPFLPAHGLGGSCRMFLTTDRMNEYRDQIASLTSELATVKKRLESAEGLRPMSEAPKDRTYIMAKFQQPDPEFSSHAWHGRTFVVRHEGYTDRSGHDMGWSLFPGYGGCPDQMFAGWMPLPSALQEQEKQG